MRIRFLLFLCLASASAAMADAADDVRAQEVLFSQSVESKDATAFREFIDADARFVGDGVSRGPEAVAAAWSEFFAADGPRIKWRPQIVEVLQDGTLALSRGPYVMTVTDAAGAETEYWGTFNSIWRLQEDGSWKVVFDAGSPAAAAPAEAIKALLD